MWESLGGFREVESWIKRKVLLSIWEIYEGICLMFVRIYILGDN